MSAMGSPVTGDQAVHAASSPLHGEGGAGWVGVRSKEMTNGQR